MFAADPKPVAVVVLEGFKHEGVHYEPGTEIKAMPGDLAMELAGQGRIRLKEEAAAPAGKAAKAAA